MSFTTPRLLAGGLVALAALAAPASAAPVVAGAITIELLTCDATPNNSCAGITFTPIAGQSAVLIARADGSPLVNAGALNPLTGQPESSTVSLVFTAVPTVSGGLLGGWALSIAGETGASTGESVDDLNSGANLAFLSSTPTMSESATFSPVSGLLLSKDLNGTFGAIFSTVQGLPFAAAVPAPAALALFGLGLAGLVALRRPVGA